MSLDERLSQELTAAIRAGDTLRRDVLRLVRNAIKYEEIAQGRPLEEDESLQVLQRQGKQRRESIEEFRRGNRADLVERESAELKILEEYLPAQMSREEISELARQAIQEMGAGGPGDRGKVMGRLMSQFRGKAEGTTVNEVVTELLESLVQR